MLNLAFMNKLDNWLMHFTVNRLKRRKEAGKMVPIRGKVPQLPLSERHYCKHNPAYFQAEVLQAHAERMDHLLSKHRLPAPQPGASFAGR